MQDNKKEYMTVVISLSKDIYEKLKAQLDFVKGLNGSETAHINTVESLIAFYIRQLVESNTSLEDLHTKMSKVIGEFEKNGVDIKSVLKAFKNDGKLFDYFPEDLFCDEDELDDEEEDDDIFSDDIDSEAHKLELKERWEELQKKSLKKKRILKGN